MTSTRADDLTPEELRAAAALRADLLAADYTVDGLERLLGRQASAALHRDQFAAVRWQLDRTAPLAGSAPLDQSDSVGESAPLDRAELYGGSGSVPVALLVRLFLLGDVVPATAVDDALPGCGTAGLSLLELVHVHDGRVSAALDLRPYAEVGGPPWWLVADLGEQLTGRAFGTEYVLGVGQASLTLAAATPRPRVARALDLGVGCGVQTLHLARHCDRLVATDLSARALRLARLSFALSGVPVDCRRGDLLAPVDGEQFDLVVSNPPFVITPRSELVPTFTYRDAGRAGDDLVHSLLTTVGARLAPGGLFVALGNWEVHGDPSGWRDRVGGWLDQARDGSGHPLDAWVIQRELLDPAEYAGLWARDGGTDAVDRDALVRAWLDDFAARGVAAVGLGLILLRRPGPGTRPLRRIEHRPEPLPDDLGAHLLGCLTAHDRLSDPIAASRLRCAPGLIEIREHPPGEPDPTAIRLTQPAGFGRSVRLDTAAAAFVGACDGELTVGQLAAAIAGLLDVDPAQTLAGLSASAADLVLDGILTC